MIPLISKELEGAVSPSERQKTPEPSIRIMSPTIMLQALRGLENDAAHWERVMKPAIRKLSSYKGYFSAYYRRAVGPDLLMEQLIQTKEHLLIVIKKGTLVLASSRGPLAVPEGGCAIIAAGTAVITEIPSQGEDVCYWIISFTARVLRKLVEDQSLLESIASRVTPAFWGVYVQTGAVFALRANGLLTPCEDISRTFRILLTRSSASFIMFLKNHFFNPRAVVKSWSRRNRQDIEHLYPGGWRAYRKALSLYRPHSNDSD